MVIVYGRAIVDNLIELKMVNFDVTMEIDLLSFYYDTVHCRTKMDYFHFPGEPVIEWRGDFMIPRGRFIFFLKA